MTPTAQPLDQARAAHRAGDFIQAERRCRGLLEAEPANADAWRLLGSALHGQGKHAEAVEAYQRALQLLPESIDVHLGLASAQAAQGRRDEAEAHFRRVLRLRPDHVEALAPLGLLLAGQGRLDEAIAFLRRAAQLRPEHAPAHHNLGVALAQNGKPEEAVLSLEQAARLRPDYPDAFFNLGNVLQSLGRRDEAAERYREAIRLRPGYGEPYNNLGLLLNEAGRHAEAAVVLQQAVRLRPQAVEAHNNLGLAYAELGRFAEAEACYREALRLDPRYAEGHGNLANLWKDQGRPDEALAGYQNALWLNPEAASVHYNRSLTLLQSGDYARGWKEYEWRWRRKRAKPRPFRQPRWDGSPLDGRTILLWCEQGLGDAIQFLRYAPLVKAKGGRVVVECPGFMVPLFSTCTGMDALLAEGAALPEFDVQAPLMSLPGLLGTTLETAPADVPYLHAVPGRVEVRRARLEGVRGFRVGVAWQGNPHHQWDRWRSFPLACLAPLAAVAGVRLISLQKGAGVEQLKALRGRFRVEELPGEVDAAGAAFLDTAAVMKNLDLVVTADTAAAHVAGALGVPTWIALSTISDWRWLLGREDTPWYPAVRLFRQDNVGDWTPVFERMAADLRRVKDRASRRGLVGAEIAPGELLDRISILEIKAERITDAGKLAHVRAELAALRDAWNRDAGGPDELVRLRAELKAVNEALWEVEDGLRVCERAGDFGERFIELARSVYRRNDERAALKRQINELLGSPWTDAKDYAGRSEESHGSGDGLCDHLTGLGIEDVRIAPRSPWQDPFAERLIGSIWRECLDHLMLLMESHLNRLWASYFNYNRHAPDSSVAQR